MIGVEGLMSTPHGYSVINECNSVLYSIGQENMYSELSIGAPFRGLKTDYLLLKYNPSEQLFTVKDHVQHMRSRG